MGKRSVGYRDHTDTIISKNRKKNERSCVNGLLYARVNLVSFWFYSKNQFRATALLYGSKTMYVMVTHWWSITFASIRLCECDSVTSVTLCACALRSACHSNRFGCDWCCCVCAVTIIFHIQPKIMGFFSFLFVPLVIHLWSQVKIKAIQIQSKARHNINFNSLELCCCACIYLCQSVECILQLNIGLCMTEKEITSTQTQQWYHFWPNIHAFRIKYNDIEVDFYRAWNTVRIANIQIYADLNMWICFFLLLFLLLLLLFILYTSDVDCNATNTSHRTILISI